VSVTLVSRHVGLQGHSKAQRGARYVACCDKGTLSSSTSTATYPRTKWQSPSTSYAANEGAGVPSDDGALRLTPHSDEIATPRAELEDLRASAIAWRELYEACAKRCAEYERTIRTLGGRVPPQRRQRKRADSLSACERSRITTASPICNVRPVVEFFPLDPDDETEIASETRRECGPLDTAGLSQVS